MGCCKCLLITYTYVFPVQHRRSSFNSFIAYRIGWVSLEAKIGLCRSRDEVWPSCLLYLTPNRHMHEYASVLARVGLCRVQTRSISKDCMTLEYLLENIWELNSICVQLSALASSWSSVFPPNSFLQYSLLYGTESSDGTSGECEAKTWLCSYYNHTCSVPVSSRFNAICMPTR